MIPSIVSVCFQRPGRYAHLLEGLRSEGPACEARVLNNSVWACFSHCSIAPRYLGSRILCWADTPGAIRGAYSSNERRRGTSRSMQEQMPSCQSGGEGPRRALHWSPICFSVADGIGSPHAQVASDDI